MTRDEAIQAIHRAHHPEDLGGSATKSISNRLWAEKAVDGYVALGMLKLDEPKNPTEKFHEFFDGMTRDERNMILDGLSFAGLKIVEK